MLLGTSVSPPFYSSSEYVTPLLSCVFFISIAMTTDVPDFCKGLREIKKTPDNKGVTYSELE
jgi:hypothetical protein